jgi:hypothetical protein
MIHPPRTTEGNVAASIGVLAAGTVLGAVIGHQISPLPPDNKVVGAIEGGTIGVLATAFGGLVVGAASPRWRRLGEMTGLVGVGTVAVLALLGASKMASASTSPSNQIPPTTTVPPVAGGGLQTLTSDAVSKYLVVTVSDLMTAGIGTLVLNVRVGDKVQIVWDAPSGFDWTLFDDQARIASQVGGLNLADRTGNAETYYATKPGVTSTRAAMMSTGAATGLPPAKLLNLRVNVSP